MRDPALAPSDQPPLACPRDRAALVPDADGAALVCAHGHAYPTVHGVPVMLLEEVDPTHPYFRVTLSQVATGAGEPEHAPSGDDVDPWVQDEIVKTNGFLYQNLQGKLTRYPVPEFRFAPERPGETLLDVGCNWGRWCLSSARAGFSPTGIDPSLDAVRAAGRVARQLGRSARFVAGDGRHLPFADGAFDVTHSYSVLQHFSKVDARQALREMARVTRTGGRVIVQLPNVFGVRQAYNLARQKLARDSNPFRVRYWTPAELRASFESAVGPCGLEIDGFFSLNPQAADLDLLAPRYGAVVRVSEALRRAGRVAPVLAHVADSLYAVARKR